MPILNVDYEVANDTNDIKKSRSQISLDHSTQLQDVSFKKVFNRHKIGVTTESSIKEKDSADLFKKVDKNKVKFKTDFDPNSLIFSSVNHSNSFLSSKLMKKLDHSNYGEQQYSVQGVGSNYLTKGALNSKTNESLKNLTERIQLVFSELNLIESQQGVSEIDELNKDRFSSSKLLDQENNSKIQNLIKDYIKLLNKQFSNLTFSDGKSIESASTEVLKTGKTDSSTQKFFMFADNKIRRDFGISFDYLKSMFADFNKQSPFKVTSEGSGRNTDSILQADDFHEPRVKVLTKQSPATLNDYNSVVENETTTGRQVRAINTSIEGIVDRKVASVLSEVVDVANVSNIRVVDLKDSGSVGTTYLEKFAHLKSTIGPELIRHSNILIREGGGEIKLLIRPESMGNVRISITIENGSLDGKIMVENTIVRDLIENNLPSLRSSLKSEGFNTLSLDVSVGDDKNKGELQNENQEIVEVSYDFDSDDNLKSENEFLTDQVIDLVV